MDECQGISKFIKIFRNFFWFSKPIKISLPKPKNDKVTFRRYILSSNKIVKIYNFQTSSSLAELGPSQPQLVPYLCQHLQRILYLLYTMYFLLLLVELQFDDFSHFLIFILRFSHCFIFFFLHCFCHFHCLIPNF